MNRTDVMENTLKQRALETFYEYWTSHRKIYPKEKEKINYYFDDRVSGFGTGAHELWKDRNDICRLIINEDQQVVGDMSIHIHWTTAEELNENFVLVYGEIAMEIPLRKRVHILDRVRVSSLMKLNQEVMQIYHMHVSVPDPMQSHDEITTGAGVPRLHEEATVLFIDFVESTKKVSMVEPEVLIDELNEIFGDFDDILDKNQIEKVKTMGDAYMAVAGLSGNDQDHAHRTIHAAREILEYLAARNRKKSIRWHLRTGIHTGPVIAGVIGKRKLNLDIFGDTVNIASGMERKGKPDRINISAHTYALIKDQFDCQYRGEVKIKGKGKMDMYLVY